MARLYKRGRIWYSDLYINKRRTRVPLDPDRRIAESKLADLVKEQDSNAFGPGARGVSWPAFRQKFLAYSRENKEHETYLRDRAALKALDACLPIVSLSQFNGELLETFRGRRLKAGLAKSSINRELSSIKAMLKKASEWRYIRPLDLNGVKKFKLARSRPKFFTFAELTALMLVCRGQYATATMLGFYAGLRPLEIYHLPWTHVSPKYDTLSVDRCEGFTPKDFEHRTIPIHPDLASYLKSLPRVSQWVMGERVRNVRVLEAYYRKMVHKAGLRGSLYVLRHSFGSHLAMADVNSKKIRDLMGHESLETTDKYMHLSPSTLVSAVAKLPAGLAGLVTTIVTKGSRK